MNRTFFSLLAISMLLWGNVFSQQKYTFNVKKNIAPILTYFIAGGFDGAMDGLSFHYDKGNTFWNPDLSYGNKWKHNDKTQGERFMGSSTVFVFATDGWHLMKMGRNLFTGATIILKLSDRKKWYYYIVDAFIYQAMNRIGFNIIYARF